jgi:proteasome accessory factor B
VDRLERLVNLVVALLDTRRPLTREELRRRVGGYSEDDENFHRNFERDKDLLRQMGIPVVAEPLGPNLTDPAVGYRVPRDLYELPDPGLDEDELVALSLAVSAVAFDGSAQSAATTALWKLAAGKVAPGGTGEQGERSNQSDGGDRAARIGQPMADVPADERVAALFSGVSMRRVARFEYNGVPRRVDPYRLSYREGRWYLAGYDHSREGERLFRADRITGAVTLEDAEDAFERPEDVASGPPPPWRLGDDEEIVVDLRVEPGPAEWVRTLAGDESVAETTADGSVHFKLRVTNRAAFRGFVLGLLEHAEVMGPPEVRDEMVYWLVSLAGLEGPARAHSASTRRTPHEPGPIKHGPAKQGPAKQSEVARLGP